MQCSCELADNGTVKEWCSAHARTYRAAVNDEAKACLAAIDECIKSGDLPEPRHSERNGMVLAYNIIHERLMSKDQLAI